MGKGSRGNVPKRRPRPTTDVGTERQEGGVTLLCQEEGEVSVFDSSGVIRCWHSLPQRMDVSINCVINCFLLSCFVFP